MKIIGEEDRIDDDGRIERSSAASCFRRSRTTPPLHLIPDAVVDVALPSHGAQPATRGQQLPQLSTAPHLHCPATAPSLCRKRETKKAENKPAKRRIRKE
jgi:hypothetical protein